MKSLRKIMLILFAAIVTPAVSQHYAIDSIFSNRPEVYFSLGFSHVKELAQLDQKIYIDQLDGETLFAYANQPQFERLISNGYTPILLSPPSMTDEYPVMKSFEQIRESNQWNFYPTYEAYESMMYQFASDFPELCTIYNIKTLTSGRKILMININNSNSDVNIKPEVYYTATMHGDELAGYVLTLRLIEYLLINYGTNDRVTYLVDHLNIWLNPLANPDGTYAAGNHTVVGSTRGNANGIDLNRNFPDPRVGDNPDGNPYQQETVAFMNFEADRYFVLSANMHGGAEVANYPWDTWFKRAADDAWWIMVTREYADTAQFYSPPGYFNDLNNGITNGYDWYSITGGRQDYMNYFRNCREFTLELSSAKRPPASQLPSFWEYNYRSFLNYLEQGLFGFNGIITNGETGNPIRATVTILNHDLDNSHVYSALPNGNYHRPVKAGTYDISFSGLGYHTRTFEGITIGDRESITLDVELYTGTLIADFSASNTIIPKGSTVDFYDESYGQSIVSWEWAFEGGEPSSSSLQNPSGIFYPESGDFAVSLTITNADAQTNTITKENFVQVRSTYNMQQGVFYSCEGLFYDSGGPDGNYQNNENYILTFYPGTEDQFVKVNFTSFNIEFHQNCEYDWLKIYDGTSTSAPLLGTWCGSNSPGQIVASNAEGALTFWFQSDQSLTGPGWVAAIECTTAVGLDEKITSLVQLFPNPVTDGNIQVVAETPITYMMIYDNKGILKKEVQGNGTTTQQVDLKKMASGLYLITVQTTKSVYSQKIIIH
jgi:hypothetical protein